MDGRIECRDGNKLRKEFVSGGGVINAGGSE